MQKILLVDDEPLNLKLIAAYLYGEPYELLNASNALQAIKILEETHDIKLILLDLMMPDMNGLEFAKVLKRNVAWQNIPIIMQTAAAEKDKVDDCIKHGIKHFLIKPFEQMQLIELSRSILNG